MNSNNSLIISHITRQVSNIPVMGYQDVPVEFYSLRNTSHSYDFRNLLAHCRGVMEKNANTQDNSLIVLKSKELDAAYWNDQSFMEDLNKTSFFQENITEYKNAVKSIVDSGIYSRQFLDLSTASENITACLMKTIYYTKGMDGIDLLNDNLSKIIHGCHFNPDCLQIYNVIIYSAPFMLIDAANGNAFSQLAFFHSPYELISASMQNYLSTFQFEDLPLLLKMQLHIEKSIADMQTCRELHNILKCICRQGIVFGTASFVTIPTVGLLRYVYLMRRSSSADLALQRIPHNRGDTVEGDFTDILINIVVDTILNS